MPLGISNRKIHPVVQRVLEMPVQSKLVQAEYGLVPDTEEAAQIAVQQEQIQELRDLFVYALKNTMQESAEMATHGLLRLGALSIVEDLLDRYNRNLPPFRGARGRWKKRGGEGP